MKTNYYVVLMSSEIKCTSRKDALETLRVEDSAQIAVATKLDNPYELPRTILAKK